MKYVRAHETVKSVGIKRYGQKREKTRIDDTNVIYELEKLEKKASGFCQQIERKSIHCYVIMK